MLYVEYPIQGELRFPQLIIEFIFIIVCIELGIVFFIRYFRQEKTLRNLQDLGYGFLLGGFGLMSLWFLISDYFASPSVRIIFLIFGYYTLMFSALFFISCMENYRKYLLFKRFFTMSFILITSIFTIGIILDLENSRILSVIPWPLFLLFFFIYLIDFSKKVQNRERVIIGLLKFIPGFMLLIIGFALTTFLFEDVLGLNMRIVGALLQLIAIILLFGFFSSLPPFSEFEWEQKIEQVFIMARAGICLYNENLLGIKEKELIDENLIAGAITSVNLLLEELTSDTGVVVINKKGKSIVIYPGKYVYGVIFCSEELNYIRVLAKRFVDKFETVYSHILINWDGEITIFKPTTNIVREIFIPEQ